jgi:hypothetical protein
MAKITRKTASIFAGSASPAPNGIAQFGSLAASAAAYSTDPATIQALSEWLAGWNSALVSGAAPAIEDMNAVHYVFGYQLAYLLQQGIAEWDPGTTYYTNGFCSYNGVIYQSLADANLNNNPSLGGAYWVPFNSGIAPWNAIVSYTLNAFVTYNGVIYVSLQNTNLNNIPAPGSSYWLPYSSTNAFVSEEGTFAAPSSSGNWMVGTNNSITIPSAGTWRIDGTFYFSETHDDDVRFQLDYFASNGADSVVTPDLLSTIAGLTPKSVDTLAFPLSFHVVLAGFPNFSQAQQMIPIIIALTGPATIYLDASYQGGFPADVTGTSLLTATQLSLAIS